MKKLTQIGAFATLILFLTACEQPSTPKAAPQTEQTKTEQPLTEKTESPKTEEIKTKAEEVKSETGAQDYKVLREWQAAEEKSLSDAIDSATTGLSDKQKEDPTLVQEAVNQALLAQIDKIKASADQLNIQDAEVKALKDKTMAVLSLGAEMIVEGAKMEKNPTPEAHKAFGELQSKLNQLAEEGQQLESKLRQKYEPAPEAPQSNQNQ